MRKMFFAYERSQVDGHWQPAVFYDDDPSLLKSANGKESNRVLSTVWPIPEDCCDHVGGKKNPHLEPNFGKLQKKFKP